MQGNWTPVSDSQRCLPFLWPVLRNCHNLVALCQLLMSCWTYVWYFKPLPHEGTIEAPWTMWTTVFAWFMSSWMDYHIWLQVIVVLGGPTLYMVWCTFSTQLDPPLLKPYLIWYSFKCSCTCSPGVFWGHVRPLKIGQMLPQPDGL